MWNLAISKPENHNLRSKTAVRIEISFNGKKKLSFIADNKLQVDQTKRKIEAKFNKSLFIKKSNTFKSHNDHKFSSNQLDTTMWSHLGIQLDLSVMSFGLKFSVI